MRNGWINKANVDGIVYEHKLRLKECGPNTKNPGQQFITGDVTVAVSDDMLTTVPVNFGFITEFFNKKNDDGTPKRNTTFDLLKRLIDNNETIANPAYGKNGALRISIQGEVECNDFCLRDSGELVAQRRLRGVFAHVGSPTDKMGATFETDMLIKSYTEREMEDEENYGILDGYVFNWRNDFMPVTYNVRIPAAMKYFDKADISQAEPLLTRLQGKIVSNTVERTVEEEGAFGEPIVKSTSSTFRSWDIFFAAKDPYEFGEDEVMTKNDIKAGMKIREEKLAGIKADWESRKENASAFAAPASSAPAADDDEDFAF